MVLATCIYIPVGPDNSYILILTMQLTMKFREYISNRTVRDEDARLQLTFGFLISLIFPDIHQKLAHVLPCHVSNTSTLPRDLGEEQHVMSLSRGARPELKGHLWRSLTWQP